MKLSKKIIAFVAMAAFCCTLVVPVVAKAAFNNCPPHYIVEQNHHTEVYTEEHDYLYAIIKHADGTIENKWETCTITTTVELCDRICEKCGMSTIYEISSETVHSDNCGQQ